MLTERCKLKTIKVFTKNMLRKRVGKHISFHFDKKEDSVFKFPLANY